MSLRRVGAASGRRCDVFASEAVDELVEPGRVETEIETGSAP